MVTAKQKQKEISALLAQNGIEEAEYEAKLLIESVSSLSNMQILMGDPFPENKLLTLQSLIQRRLIGVPVQYLLGQWEFYGLDFAVGEGVLIPRQDTEILVETALSHLQKANSPVYLDLCSGTGCIPIAIGENLKIKTAYAIEYSEKAYAYLTQNITSHHADYLIPKLADALCADTIEQFSDETFDCITSNPPYLNEADMQNLQKEVCFEPKDALYAPENGLFFYRFIPKLWSPKLKPGGMLAFEVGIHQAESVKQLMQQNGFTDIQTANDLAGIARVVYGYKK